MIFVTISIGLFSFGLAVDALAYPNTLEAIGTSYIFPPPFHLEICLSQQVFHLKTDLQKTSPQSTRSPRRPTRHQ